jgi:hypothetical protein
MFATDATRRNYSMTRMELQYASLAKLACVQDAWALNHITLRNSTRRVILLFIMSRALHKREPCAHALGILRRLTKQEFWTSKNYSITTHNKTKNGRVDCAGKLEMKVNYI